MILHGATPCDKGLSVGHFFMNMSDEFSNGAAWDAMMGVLFDLHDSLEGALNSRVSCWQPEPSAEQRSLSCETWKIAESRYRAGVHAAARELVRPGGLVDPAPEVLYFLSIRLQAAMQQVEQTRIIRSDRPVSLIPFPPVETADYAEWLLTEWADEHAIGVVFPG